MSVPLLIGAIAGALIHVACGNIFSPDCLIWVAVRKVLNWILNQRLDDLHLLIKPPGGHWLWGHEHDAWATPDSEWYIRNVEENGLVFPMKGALFHSDLLVVADPAALHHIFTHSHRFIKSTVQRPLMERIVGRGLLWAEQSEHTRQRQMVAPLFTSNRVKGMENDIRDTTATFIDKFRHHILSNSAFSPVDGLRVNVMSWLTRPTLDIIGKVALGHDFGCGDSSEAQAIRKGYKELIDIGMTFAGFVGPLVLRTFPWIPYLPIPAIQAQGTIKTIVKDIARKIVDDTIQAGEDDIRSRNDLLGKLIRNTDASKDEDVDLMLDQICTFVIAGHETTTITMSMILLELARQPEVQTALRKEIMEFGGSGPGGQLSYDDLLGFSLPLLDAVCKEGLRRWPVGSHEERIADQDDVIPLRFPVVSRAGETLTSMRVQKGQVFYIPIIAVNSNTQMWGPDGHKFDPYRWIEPGRLPPSTNLTGGINGHFTFIEGPRLCVGHRLAIFELKVILSAMIKNFEFKTTDEEVQTMWATTLQPYVCGQQHAGPQLPLFVRPVDT